MGLDMYLTANRYLYGDDGLKLRDQIQELTKQSDYPVKEIVFEVGYWRKANAIHKWFVDNVQDGNDDCGTYYVSDENLQELLDLVNDELKSDKKSRGSRLPTQSGFFFGSTEYDESYMSDLKLTKDIIKKYLSWEGKSDCDLHYHSSW